MGCASFGLSSPQGAASTDLSQQAALTTLTPSSVCPEDHL